MSFKHKLDEERVDATPPAERELSVPAHRPLTSG